MTLALQADPLPLQEDEHGTIRVRNTRVTLDLVVRALQDGATAQEIVRRFDTLDLADVHTLIGHYLRHRREIDEYLDRREKESAELQRQIEKAMPPRISKDELQARWKARSES